MTNKGIAQRASLLSRSALGLALALGTIAAGGLTAPAAFAKDNKAPAAPKVNLSKGFRAVAAPFDASVSAAIAAPATVAAKAAFAAASQAYNAATTNSARTAARPAMEAARAALRTNFTGPIAQVDPLLAAATSNDDRFTAGQLILKLGISAEDLLVQRKGIATQIASGMLPAADIGKFNYFSGSMAYDAGDYPAALAGLNAAIAAGYTDGDAQALLAETYFKQNQNAAGLNYLKTTIAANRAAGRPVPALWLRRGLSIAYNAKMVDDVGTFASLLAELYPNHDNWAGAISTVREVAHYPLQDELDLMRLMDRTNSYSETRDYLEYIESADARRLPQEVLTVIQKGITAGKLNAGDVFVVEARGIANARVAPMRATLAALQRDAGSASSDAATAMGAGDVFLNFADAPKAEAAFTSALTKPGVDTNRALTRLGIAQVDAGEYPAAIATFAKITGPRVAMARLWSIFAKQKMQGTPVAAAAH